MFARSIPSILTSTASVTGEDRRTIARRGFSPLNLGPVELEDDDFHEPLVVDWDQLELDRGLLIQ